MPAEMLRRPQSNQTFSFCLQSCARPLYATGGFPVLRSPAIVRTMASRRVASKLAAFIVGFSCGLSNVAGQLPGPSGWTVTGTVLDSVSGQPLAGALVIWEPSFAAYGFRDRPANSSGPAPTAARIVTGGSGGF